MQGLFHEELRVPFGQLLVPLNVLDEPLLQWEPRLVAQQALRLLHRQSAAFGHEEVARLILYFDARKLGFDDLGHLIEAACSAEREVEYLIACLGSSDAKRDALHEVPYVGKVQAVRTIAVNAQGQPSHRVLDESLSDPTAHAPFAVERRGSEYGVSQLEYLVIGDDQLLA